MNLRKSQMGSYLWLLAASFSLSGCLMTRGDVKEAEQKKAVQDQVITLQKSTADQTTRFNEINSDLRDLNGRIDIVENKINILARQTIEKNGGDANRTQDLEKKMVLMQEEMAKLEGQIVILNQELQGFKANQGGKAEADTGSGKEKSLIDVADDHFGKKEWKKAILAYQRYRDQNPKSKKFARATFRIGASFSELGMAEEARTFYEEVLTKFPDSPEAKNAKSKLKKK